MNIVLFLATVLAVHGLYLDMDVVRIERHIKAAKTLPYKKRHLQNGDQLLFSQVVWRHGDRAPTGTYPNDVHQENSWPNGWGELTQIGMRQQYALGKLLYERYINSSRPLLSEEYNSKEVYIRSTDVNRTLLSAYSNLAGMFGNGKRGEDFPDSHHWPIGWTPVPVHTLPENQDPIGNVFAPCERADELYEDIKDSDQWINFVDENQDFLDFLSEKTGMEVVMDKIYDIHDANYIETLYNMSQPSWMTPEVSEKLTNLSMISAKFMFGIGDPYVPELIRLRGGPLLKSIINNMNLKIECFLKNNTGDECKWISNLKYYAYSAHDTTVYGLLATLGDEEKVITGGMPHYTASVAIELWNLVDSGPAIKILFHSAFHHKYHVITHLAKGCPQNTEFCSLKTFNARSEKFVPVDLERECRKQKPERVFPFYDPYLSN